MTFRDDRDAMRARLEELEREAARDEERANAAERERDALKREKEALESELATLRHDPKANALRSEHQREVRLLREREEREAEEREAEARKAAERREAADSERDAAPSRWLKRLGAIAGVAVLGFGFVSLCAPPTWTASHAAPSLGMIDLSATPSPELVSGTASGERPTPVGCAGAIPSAPHVVLRTEGPTFTSLLAESSVDTVLVLLAADGTTYCDDDSGGGSNPALGALLPAGEQRVWVGVYDEAQTAPFTLRVSAVSPPDGPLDARGLAPTATPAQGVHAIAPAPSTFRGEVSPRVAAAPIDGRCRGYLDMAPTLALDVPVASHAQIEAASPSFDDLVLFVEGPSGSVHCDDDGGPGTAPLIAELLSPGRYRLWVGSYASRTTPLPYTLVVRGTPQSSLVEPRPQSLGLEQTLTITGASSLVHDVPCNALVSPGPDAVLDLATNLDVQLESPRTGTLLRVEGPDGSRCLGPGASTWARGRHRVSVARDPESAAEPAPVTLHTHAPSLVPYSP